ncbi:hypothetical protein AVEN_79104-1 [Araneus ventricosus]|uniref:Uncharacterized protein n=1 Tax=Araneus ventricosus TaxID=182803 RepID=A0A4Y2QBR5_ARAVE|nr:hypothetical protein AVEN_79104-1 [Araneus ventricosus]
MNPKRIAKQVELLLPTSPGVEIARGSRSAAVGVCAAVKTICQLWKQARMKPDERNHVQASRFACVTGTPQPPSRRSAVAPRQPIGLWRAPMQAPISLHTY